MGTFTPNLKNYGVGLVRDVTPKHPQDTSSWVSLYLCARLFLTCLCVSVFCAVLLLYSLCYWSYVSLSWFDSFPWLFFLVFWFYSWYIPFFSTLLYIYFIKFRLLINRVQILIIVYYYFNTLVQIIILPPVTLERNNFTLFTLHTTTIIFLQLLMLQYWDNFFLFCFLLLFSMIFSRNFSLIFSGFSMIFTYSPWCRRVSRTG